MWLYTTHTHHPETAAAAAKKHSAKYFLSQSLCTLLWSHFLPQIKAVCSLFASSLNTRCILVCHIQVHTGIYSKQKLYNPSLARAFHTLSSWTAEDTCLFLHSHSSNMRAAAAGGFSNEIFSAVRNQPRWLWGGIQHQNVILAYKWVLCPRGRPGARVRVWHTGGKLAGQNQKSNAERWAPAAAATRSVNASHTGEISWGKNKCTLGFVDLAKAGSQKCRYTADNRLAERNAHDFLT